MALVTARGNLDGIPTSLETFTQSVRPAVAIFDNPVKREWAGEVATQSVMRAGSAWTMVRAFWRKDR